MSAKGGSGGAGKRQGRDARWVEQAGVSTVEPNAAGMDAGATEMYVCVPADRDEQPVRRFGSFTEDLHAMADWMQSCGIDTVAMESTGVYWVPAFQILEQRGIRVCLVNAQHVHNVPGRKSDVSDCQWLQSLHAAGLLRASFRPPDEICAIRSLWRHRNELVQMAAEHVQHMQKALDQMNVQLHHVISDITGNTGLAIVDAILAGQRDAAVLAKLRDPRVKADEETIARALTGDWRPEHLFTLRQSLKAWRHYQTLITDCEAEVEKYLANLQPPEGLPPLPPSSKSRKARQKYEPDFDLRGLLYKATGVDLTQIPGVSALTAQMLFTEMGPDLNAFPASGNLASWLCLCPANTITGGRVIRSVTRKGKNRAAQALRMAAQGLLASRSALGDYARRMRAKHGKVSGITVTAHKLARIVYAMLKNRKAYDETLVLPKQIPGRAFTKLQKQAQRMGYALTPLAQE